MDDFLRTPVWYPALSRYTFKTLFLELSPEELRALAAGEEEGATAGAVIAKLKPLLSATPGNAFVFVDSCAPTDTERFAGKRGAVYSAKSAWKFLCRSEKVRRATIGRHGDPLRGVDCGRCKPLAVIDIHCPVGHDNHAAVAQLEHLKDAVAAQSVLRVQRVETDWRIGCDTPEPKLNASASSS